MEEITKDEVQTVVDIDAELQAMDQDPIVLVDVGRGVFLELLIDVPQQTRLLQKYKKVRTPIVTPQNAEKFLALRNTIKKDLGKEDPTGDEIQTFLEEHEDMMAEYVAIVQPEEDNTDWYSLGVALCRFIQGWRGTNSLFTKDKLKRWVSRKRSVAEKLAQNFETILNRYEKAHERKKEDERKN